MTTRSQMVTRTIREHVLTGVYPGGARLNEVELATALSVSRTPVRGALSTLATEGLLEYRPNCGYVVRRFSVNDIANVYQVRGELDGLAARLAAERGLDDVQRGTLARLNDEGEELVRSNSSDETIRDTWLRVNREFHSIIYEASGNPYLATLLRQTNLPIMGHLRSLDFDRVAMARLLDDHVEILDAIVSRNTTRASALGGEHVYRAGRRLIDLMRRRELAQSSGRRPTLSHPLTAA